MAEALTFCALMLSGATCCAAQRRTRFFPHHDNRRRLPRRRFVAGVHQGTEGGIQAAGHLLGDLPGTFEGQLSGFGLQPILVFDTPCHLAALVGPCLDGGIQYLCAIGSASFHRPALLYLELAAGFLGGCPLLIAILLHGRDALRLALNGFFRDFGGGQSRSNAFDVLEPRA